MDTSTATRVNYHLRQERIRRSWRQLDLAEQLGTTVVTVKRWERGYQQPSSYFRVKLCALFGKSAEELGFVSDVAPEEAVVWGIPFPRNLFFTGRDDILEQLHAVLTSEPTIAALTQSYALHGLGGIGKTQLAIEYAYRYRFEYHAILWVEAETQTSLTSSFVRLAALLALPEEKEENQSKIITAVLRWFNQHEGWLLIFDNVEDLSLIKPFLPASDQGALLLTTRLQTLGTLAQRVDLPLMNMQEGSDFLLARTNRKEYAAIDQQEYVAAQAIITAMGGLPLALEQAGAYIDAAKCSLSDYLDLFQEMQHYLLDEHEPSSDHPLSVNRTFLLAFEQVEQHNPLAAELLTTCAFLAPEAIPERIFLEGAFSLGPTFEVMATDPLSFPAAIKVLLSYSLIQRSAPTRTITVHRLVQAVLKARLTEAERHVWGWRVVDTMGRLFPSDERKQMNYLPTCEPLVTHAQTCLFLVDQWNDNEALHIPLMSHVASYLSNRGRYAEAVSLFERAWQIGERVLGAGHPLVAEALYGLACLYREQGKYTEAESLFKRALIIRTQALGPEHSEVGFPLNGLGILYGEQGKYEQSEACYQQALYIWERTLGPEHYQVASPLNNLGALYYEQGKYKEATPYYQRALRIWEQALGPDHPQLAFSLTGLGNLYDEQGEYAQSEACYLRALHIWEQALGSEHPHTAFPLNNLGEIYREQGKYEQSEACYQRALHIREQALGFEHPIVASSLSGLGDLYVRQGKYEQVEPYYQRALHIWKQAFGSEHPRVACALNGLANLSREQGKYEDANLLYQRALTIRQQFLSPQHPEIAETLHDLARFHQLQQQTAEALLLYQQALSIREQVHGSQHLKTQETRAAIAQLLQKMNEET